MAGELVRYNPSEARKKIEQALEIARQTHELIIQEPAASPPQQTPRHPPWTALLRCLVKTDDVLDVLRACCVHDRPYASRYILRSNGTWEYQGPIQVNKLRYRLQYEESGSPLELPNQYLDQEECAWCGSVNMGAIFCGLCKTFVCYGKTVHNAFRCRPSCGAEGQLIRGNYHHMGVNPTIR